MRLLLSQLLIFSLSFAGCVSSTNEETNEQMKEQQNISSSTVASDSSSLLAEMKKDTAKIMPKKQEVAVKVNKPIQRPKQVSNNSADSKKDVTTKYPKTAKKSNIPIVNKTPVVKKTPPIATIPRKKGARIYFPKKTFSYGKINEGKKINHKFRFINTGDDSLLIKNVDVSCGCTIPKYSSKKIKPGGEGYIDVEYDSKGKFMNQESSIYITSNSRINPTVELMLLGYVRVPLAKDKKKNEEKDSVKTTPQKDAVEPKKTAPKLPKKPIVKTDSIKKKIKEVVAPKVVAPKTTAPKDTTTKAKEVKEPVKEGND